MRFAERGAFFPRRPWTLCNLFDSRCTSQRRRKKGERERGRGEGEEEAAGTIYTEIYVGEEIRNV